MINTDKLEYIIKCILASGYIKNERPLSLLIVSGAEAGKTTLIRKYCLKSDGIFYTTDATAYGIIRDTNGLRDFEENKYRHIVIPDLISCLSRREDTVKTFITFLNSIIEEGIVNISTYITKIRPENKKIVNINVGLITAITKDEFNFYKRKWNRIGFLSRLIPLSYDYDVTTRLKIFNYIENEEHLKDSLEKLSFNKRPRVIKLSVELAKRLEPYSLSLSELQKTYGFRLQRNFQTLLKAIAYLDDKDEVTEEHLKKFEEIITYINLYYNKI